MQDNLEKAMRGISRKEKPKDKEEEIIDDIPDMSEEVNPPTTSQAEEKEEDFDPNSLPEQQLDIMLFISPEEQLL